MKARAVFLVVLGLQPTVRGQNTTWDGTFNATTAGVDPRVLHLFDNPLPSPMGGPWGAFFLEVVAYAVLAAIALLVIAPLLKRAAKRIPGNVDNQVFATIWRPGFILLFLVGVKDSLRLLPLQERTENIVHNIWAVFIIIAATYVVLRLWKQIILSIGKRMAEKVDGEMDDKLYPFFSKVGGIVIVLAAIFFILGTFNVDLTVFAAGGAVVTVVLAFAAQDSIGNFFAGVFILLDRPFREGDRIEIKEENTWGDVVDIGLRTTRIRTRDNRMVVVPNSLIGSNAVINHSFPSTEYRIGVDVGLAYGTDIDHATEILKDAITGVEGVNTDKRIEVLFKEFGDSALEFHIRAWFPHYLDARRYEDKMNRAVDKALREAGIEIPFPQRVVHMKALDSG